MEQAAGWLWSMQAPQRSRGVLRVSSAHDPERWPGVLLSGTYDGILCLALLGETAKLAEAERGELARFVAGHRRADGVFVYPDMRAEDTFKKPDPAETARYIAFHLTNYGLGALEALGALDVPKLRFLEPFLDPMRLLAWLAERDLRDPWQEGNNIVNLASFLLLARDHGEPRAEAALRLLLDWHERNQEPATGFWGSVRRSTPRAISTPWRVRPTICISTTRSASRCPTTSAWSTTASVCRAR